MIYALLNCAVNLSFVLRNTHTVGYTGRKGAFPIGYVHLHTHQPSRVISFYICTTCNKVLYYMMIPFRVNITCLIVTKHNKKTIWLMYTDYVVYVYFIQTIMS